MEGCGHGLFPKKRRMHLQNKKYIAKFATHFGDVPTTLKPAHGLESAPI